MAIGTATRNAAPHQSESTSTPPTIGPAAIPPANNVAQTPIATARCRGSGNMFETNERVDGISVAPAIPSSALAAIRSSALCANAASSETTANAAIPTISKRRRPTRSPRVPIVTKKPASRKP